MEIMFN